MTTAFQPNAFQVNPLAFQISQIGSGRSGVIRAWLIEQTQKGIDEKRAKEAAEAAPAAPVAEPVPAPKPAPLRTAPARRVPRERQPRREPEKPFLPILHPVEPGPTMWDMLHQIPELPLAAPANLRARRTHPSVTLEAERKKRNKVRRKKAAFLMLLAV